MIVFGKRLYGKVDNVPGFFHVATNCIHVQFLPFVPTETVLVLAKEGSGYQGVRIPLSFKSYAMAWFRVAMFSVAAGSAVIGIPLLTGAPRHQLSGALTLAGVPIGLGLFFVSYFVPGLGRASYARAVQLAEIAKLREESMVLLELHFGRVSKEDAEKALAELRAAEHEIQQIAND